MKRLIKLYAMGLAILGVEKSSSFAYDDDELELQANTIALQTPFYLPLKFTTEVGTLGLTITNRPDEADNFYIRPYHLPDPGDFLEMSHLAFLREVKTAFEDLEIQYGQLLNEIKETGIVQPFLQTKYANETLERHPLPEHTANTLVSGTKEEKAELKSTIFPLYLQTYKYHLEDKYAFPYSVMTLDWIFEPDGGNEKYLPLRNFADREEFYIFINNALVEHINKIATSIYEEMNRRNKRLLHS